MRLYEIKLTRGKDQFDVGHHQGTRGEAVLKAKYSAKRLGVHYVFDETCLPGMDDLERIGNSEILWVTDIGPAQHQEDYVRGGRE